MMKAVSGALILCLLAPALAGGVEVLAVSRPPAIDGVLVEWGAPERIPVVPGGQGVGLRGAFAGLEDHEADVYLMWDARCLYVAVAVVDDTTDAARVEPGGRVWRGPGGERKDRMFYYDHLKVFLRGPEKRLGFNVWAGPSDGTLAPYVWGGAQGATPSADIPVQVGSAWRAGIYTYELSFPWDWLGIRPQPGMELDALFLLPDSDNPGLAMRKKVQAGDKWIWWQGKAVLAGTPPGLKPPPPDVAEVIRQQAQAIVLPEPADSRSPADEKDAPAVALEAAAVVEAPAASEAPETPAVAEAPEDSTPDQEEAVLSMAALRARLNRQRLGRSRLPEAPEWIRDLGRAEGLSGVQVDSLYYRLTSELHRLVSSGIDSRTDGLVVDMARYAGTWRSQARGFLASLLERAGAEAVREGSSLRGEVVRAAAAAGIAEDRALLLVEDFCVQGARLYREENVGTTGGLLDKARRRAGLSPEEARALTRALVSGWSQ